MGGPTEVSPGHLLQRCLAGGGPSGGTLHLWGPCRRPPSSSPPPALGVLLFWGGLILQPQCSECLPWFLPPWLCCNEWDTFVAFANLKVPFFRAKTMRRLSISVNETVLFPTCTKIKKRELGKSLFWGLQSPAGELRILGVVVQRQRVALGSGADPWKKHKQPLSCL